MTEAERIEKDAEEFVSGDAIFQCPPDRVLLTCYIAGATAENERLHQQIKEKSDKIAKITLFSRMYQTDIEFLKEELKSAQELNRELVEKLKSYLPKECVKGWGEVKFCPNRLSGNAECIHCTD